MNIFRTYHPKGLGALRHITTGISQSRTIFTTQKMIEEVFSRPLPIPKNFISRFGPEGLNKNILYASERKRTTLFEYGYHLLREGQPNYGKTTLVHTHTLVLQCTGQPLDISNIGNLDLILSKTTYQYSHEWMRTLDENILDTVKYPNVRENQPGGFNYAIFKKNSVADSKIQFEEFQITPMKNGEVEIVDQNNVRELIRPVMT